MDVYREGFNGCEDVRVSGLGDVVAVYGLGGIGDVGCIGSECRGLEGMGDLGSRGYEGLGSWEV